MITERQFMRGAVALLAAGMVAIGSRMTWVRADGIPSPNPLTYSGTLTEGGVAVNDMRNIELSLWDHETDRDPSHRTRCTVPSAPVRVEQGRFQVVLPEACAAVVHETRNLWVEVSVNGAPLGRTKIGAVPFAVEAERAADLTAAVRNSLVPPGTIVAFGGNEAPAGWRLCDGAAVPREGMYQALFRAAGTTYGPGDNTTTFNLPDLRGRAAVGAGTGMGLTARPMGRAFGEEQHALTVAEMPAHNHGGTSGVNSTPVWHDRGGQNYFTNQMVAPAAGANQSIPHTHVIPWEGGGAPHENMQPSLVVNYIIKY